MRHQYTPIFQKILASRVWDLSPPTRCVWLWLQLAADLDGSISCDLHGVARLANVELDEAKRAMEGFERVDPHADPDDPYQGRIVERVSGGWVVLGLDERRQLARREAHAARQRRYKRRLVTGTPSNDTEVTPGDALSTHTNTNPNTNPKPKGEEISPLPPSGIDRSELTELSDGSTMTTGELMAFADGVDAASGGLAPNDATIAAYERARVVALHQLPDDWAPSEELRADATIAGVADLDARVASLRTGPIGGARGVLPTQLDAYVRSFFGRWRAWAETDRAKARAATSARPGVSQGPSGARHTGWRGDDFVAQKYAERHGLDLHAIRLELIQSGAVDTCTHTEADKLLAKALKAAARNKGRAA